MNPSRREVLAALAVAGGAGALTGSGTSALLSDETRLHGRLTTGIVDVVGEYWHLSGPAADGGFDIDAPDGTVDGPHVTVPIGTLDEDATGGNVLLRFALPQGHDAVNNPATLWVRTACPPAKALAEFLDVRISYANADGTSGTTIASGSLREVADTLRTGFHLDPTWDSSEDGDGCLTDELFVLVEYDAGDYVGAETTELPLYLAAVQCRNTDTAVSPFDPAEIDAECEVGFSCACCWAIGKVEVEEAFQSGTTYAFDEGLAEYGIAVTAVDGDDGVAFELVRTNGGTVPPLCSVLVKGGPGAGTEYDREEDTYAFHTSGLAGSNDGFVYAPENPNSGNGYGISHVLVSVCAPRLADGSCPADVATSSATDGPPSGRERPGPQQGPDPTDGTPTPEPAVTEQTITTPEPTPSSESTPTGTPAPTDESTLTETPTAPDGTPSPETTPAPDDTTKPPGGSEQ